MFTHLRRALTGKVRTADGASRRLLLIWLWTFMLACFDGAAAFGLIFAWAATRISGLYAASQWCIRGLYLLAVVSLACTMLMVRDRRDRSQTGGDK